MNNPLKKIILVKKTMDHLEDENDPINRPAFLTVLCILTFVGSGWAIFSAVTSYNSAEKTAQVFNDTQAKRKREIHVQSDTIKIDSRERSVDSAIISRDSLGAIKNSTFDKSGISVDSSSVISDTVNKKEEFRMGNFLGEKMKKDIMDMISVDKIKKSAMGSFIAALFTLSGAISMWLLRRFGFYLYIVGIIIGIVVPFYIYGNNLLAIGISGFGSFFGLVFIALYALNLKSMK